ncbi:MAG: Wadjet anti-phage system protein JetD domain-containing protein [Gammaproteobacteria bacterium]
MKSPAQLRDKLRRQWSNGALREQRLLDTSAWPLCLPIGKPSASQITHETASVREHLQAWRGEKIGQVEFHELSYRGTAGAVELPLNWILSGPDQWIAATGDAEIKAEYRLLSAILKATDSRFHPLLIRQRQLLQARAPDETILACQVAESLEPGLAQGRPLRAVSVAGCDSKFIQRNRSLIQKLLSMRFGDAVNEQGLEAFLDAEDEGEHWLLIASLSPGLLPFQQLRLRSSELRRTPLPGTHIIIVENERSLYQLPELPNTIAILGAGRNLNWMTAPWLKERRIAYWGDIDTWGLEMLATARRHQPKLTALLMDETIFDAHPSSAVKEPQPAAPTPPDELLATEKQLYLKLLQAERGRLEQEFLREKLVRDAITGWHNE